MVWNMGGGVVSLEAMQCFVFIVFLVMGVVFSKRGPQKSPLSAGLQRLSLQFMHAGTRLQRQSATTKLGWHEEKWANKNSF
jgi:hypothetical protein